MDTTSENRPAIVRDQAPTRFRADHLSMSADLSAIDLARAGPLRLGGLEVRPPKCEVIGPAGRETLQPRIMQVLVALANASGEVVSRDDLIKLCWEGRAVGDDALNRCIARLRQLGGAYGAFTVETVPRVGYRLQAGEAPAVSAEATRADAAVLAVLPFNNLSNDPEMQFFSDGVSEEILNALARVGGLRIIGWTSSFSFRGALKSQAARELGASHLLDGSVQRASAHVRISARLTRSADGQLLWSDRFDRELRDVFALQDEIAAMIAAALSTRFAPSEIKQPLDARVTDLYLRALSICKAYDPASQERAIPYLETALAIEPDFARAQGALALTLFSRILAATVVSAPPEALDVATSAVASAARRTLEAEPTDT